MKEEAKKTVSRRKFFGAVGTGLVGGAGAIVAVTGKDATAAEDTGSGYRETQHVKTYYESTRF